MGVLNIKATLRIQIREIQGFYQSLLNVDDRFHPNWRQKLKQCEELDAGSRLPAIRRYEPNLC